MTFVALCPECGRERVVKGSPDPQAYVKLGTRRYGCRCPMCARCGGETPTRLMDKAWLDAAYAERNPSAIADQLGCAKATVNRWLRHHSIRLRSRSESLQMWHATRAGKRDLGSNRQMVTAGAKGASTFGRGQAALPEVIEGPKHHRERRA